jgi:hypothetical protein
MKKLFTNNPAEAIILLLIVVLVIIGIALGILPAPPIEPESGLQLMGLLPLLPCPFCGGQAWLKSRGGYSWVACERCGLETKKYNALGADETVFNLWNTRPKQPQLPIHQALTEFAELLTSEAGLTFLNKAGLHEDSLADYENNGFAEDEYRASIAGFALDTLRAKFQEIVEPALMPVVVSDLDRIVTALETAHEALVEFQSEDAGHLADLLATLKTAEAGALVIDDGSDPAAYTLREGADAGRGVWIRIQNIDVRVYQGDEGVSVDLYPTNSPETDAVASTWLTFAEAAEESE